MTTTRCKKVVLSLKHQNKQEQRCFKLNLNALAFSVLLTHSFVFVGCKPKSESTIQSLNNLANLLGQRTNFCSAGPREQIAVGGDTLSKQIFPSDPKDSARKGEVEIALSAIPAQLKNFVKVILNGKIIITNDFSPCTSTFGKSIDACYVLRSSQSNPQTIQGIDIRIRSSEVAIHHGLVRIFGFIYAEVLPTIESDQAGAVFLQSEPPTIRSSKEILAANFILDLMKGNSNYGIGILNQFFTSDEIRIITQAAMSIGNSAEASTRIFDNISSQSEGRLRFGNSVAAEAFDSFFCNNWSQGDSPPNTLSNFKSEFPRTFEAFPQYLRTMDAVLMWNLAPVSRDDYRNSLSLVGESLEAQSTASSQSENNRPVDINTFRTPAATLRSSVPATSGTVDFGPTPVLKPIDLNKLPLLTESDYNSYLPKAAKTIGTLPPQVQDNFSSLAGSLTNATSYHTTIESIQSRVGGNPLPAGASSTIDAIRRQDLAIPDYVRYTLGDVDALSTETLQSHGARAPALMSQAFFFQEAAAALPPINDGYMIQAVSTIDGREVREAQAALISAKPGDRLSGRLTSGSYTVAPGKSFDEVAQSIAENKNGTLSNFLRMDQDANERVLVMRKPSSANGDLVVPVDGITKNLNGSTFKPIVGPDQRQITAPNQQLQIEEFYRQKNRTSSTNEIFNVSRNDQIVSHVEYKEISGKRVKVVVLEPAVSANVNNSLKGIGSGVGTTGNTTLMNIGLPQVSGALTKAATGNEFAGRITEAATDISLEAPVVQKGVAVLGSKLTNLSNAAYQNSGAQRVLSAAVNSSIVQNSISSTSSIINRIPQPLLGFGSKAGSFVAGAGGQLVKRLPYLSVPVLGLEGKKAINEYAKLGSDRQDAESSASRLKSAEDNFLRQNGFSADALYGLSNFRSSVDKLAESNASIVNNQIRLLRAGTSGADPGVALHALRQISSSLREMRDFENQPGSDKQLWRERLQTLDPMYRAYRDQLIKINKDYGPIIERQENEIRLRPLKGRSLLDTNEN